MSGLIGSSDVETPATPARVSQPSVAVDTALIGRLRGLLSVYEKMLAASTKEGNDVKQRRYGDPPALSVGNLLFMVLAGISELLIG